MILFSSFVNMIFFFLMWRIKELQVHPMILFMLVTGCDSIELYIYSTGEDICTLGLQKIFAWTVFFDGSCESELQSLNILLNTVAFLAMSIAVFGICLQLCISIDLILII